MRVQELFDLSGRTALVTGGGRGIGRHIAIGLAEAGADVVVASRKLENCQEAARAIEALGRRALAVQADLANPDDVTALADRALSAFGRLHILVNNAGVTWGAPTLEYPIEGWDRVFNVNVRGLWLISQRIARHMKAEGSGAILHITSISSYRGAPDEREPAIAYNASKGAVTALTGDMAVKLAPHGIRVNALAPGAFLTQMMEYLTEDEQKLSEFLSRVPLRRAGREDDIKGAAVFLVSDAAAYVTGTTLVVDGGLLAG
ncbi:MAG: glucose 1-dehydrogenase [Deltaproteobacteria bacterium]|nr:MAG: glucose 1-dehydrogenase [Deltaproteobacteria bacterium]